jgi:hypothetical protein
MLKPIAVATLIAGTLDIVAAFTLSALAGVSPVRVLQFVASGPLGDGALAGTGYAAAGLAVHFGIMTFMAAAYMIVAARVPALLRHPLVAGPAYGLLLWFVMYWLVRPVRWPNLQPTAEPAALAGQLFCHLILVGIPIALVARHFLLPRQPAFR